MDGENGRSPIDSQWKPPQKFPLAHTWFSLFTVEKRGWININGGYFSSCLETIKAKRFEAWKPPRLFSLLMFRVVIKMSPWHHHCAEHRAEASWLTFFCVTHRRMKGKNLAKVANIFKEILLSQLDPNQEFSSFLPPPRRLQDGKVSRLFST